MKYHLTISLLLLSLSLFCQQKGVSPLEGGKEGENGQTYAVVVGISDYQDDGIPDLRFADKDAEAFAAFLQSPAGGSLDEDHLKVLINEQATMAQFAIALDWLWEVAQENDRVIIYFSGHGDVERKSLTQPGFLLCWDAPARVYLAGGTLALPMFQEVISTLSVQNKAKVIVITDACRSGKLSGSSVGGAQLTSNNLAKQYANEIKILSCQPDEYSIEGEQWGGGRGAFSYHLLDGLYGMADGDSDLNVSLKEIGRYLEDKVTEEVSPQNQNPMVIGDKTEKLTDVFPELLAEIKAGKKGQLQLFTSTESRGIEDEVLAAADSNVVEMYFAFQKTIEEKQFLEPENACADFYYTKLSKEPQLKKLHSSMRRNYAAALQDDAQQVLNGWLKTDIEESSRHNNSKREKFRLYPKYLGRAADLLGHDHYMYSVLKGRQLFFEGYLIFLNNLQRNEETGNQILEKYRESLVYEARRPYVFSNMSYVFGYHLNQQDSAEFYRQQASELVPSWVTPYTQLVYLNSSWIHDYKKAKHYLDRALEIDSNSWKVRMTESSYYSAINQFDRAERALNKAIELDSTVLSLYTGIGYLYTRLGRFEEAEKQFRKAEKLDSTNWSIYINLCFLNLQLRRFKKMEAPCLKCIKISPGFSHQHYYLGTGYFHLGRLDEALVQFNKAIQYNPTETQSWAGVAAILFKQKEAIKAKKMVDETIANLQLAADKEQLEKFGYELGIFGYYQESELILQSVIDENPDFALAYYDYACVLSLQKKADSSLMMLEKAMKKGYENHEWVRKDPDMEYIRTDERFDVLLKKYFPDQHKN